MDLQAALPYLALYIGCLTIVGVKIYIACIRKAPVIYADGLIAGKVWLRYKKPTT